MKMELPMMDFFAYQSIFCAVMHIKRGFIDLETFYILEIFQLISIPKSNLSRKQLCLKGAAMSPCWPFSLTRPTSPT